MSGRRHYQKGRRFERDIVTAVLEAGLLAERVPLKPPGRQRRPASADAGII